VGKRGNGSEIERKPLLELDLKINLGKSGKAIVEHHTHDDG
jgi:hypothetical protein